MRVPESDDSRAAFIATALRTAAADALKGIKYVPVDTIAAAAACLNDRTEGETVIPGFASLVTRRQLAEGRVSKEMGEAQQAEEGLHTYVRDYVAVLGRRTFRVPHSVAVLDCHKLNHSAELPPLGTQEERRTAALQLIAGDAAAVAMGFPAMVNPSAAEVQAKLTDAVRERGEVTPVDRDLQGIREQLRALRPQAQVVVDELVDELRHNTRRLEAATAREIMRSYGLSFESLPGEAPEPNQPANPAPPPTPPPPPTPTP
jgi:hypothetical protein